MDMGSGTHRTTITPLDHKFNVMANSTQTSSHKSLTPPLPLSRIPSTPPIHHHEDENVEQGLVVAQYDYGTPIQFANQDESSFQVALLPSALPQVPVAAFQHHRPSDPYSNLNPLQRDIILCIQTASESMQNATQSLYPPLERRAVWPGVNVSVIIRSVVNSRHPDVSLEEFGECIEGLLRDGHIFNPIDDEHYAML